MNQEPRIVIDPANLRRQAERQREDAETISRLCEAVDALIADNSALKAGLKKVEEEREAFKARLAKHEPQVVEGKDGKK